MTVFRNISLCETLNGGDFEFTNGDLQMSGSLWTMIYVSWFGGNPGFSSQDKVTEKEFNNDFWGNKLFHPNNPDRQINSKLERLLQTIPLISSNLTKIERVAKEDLKYISFLGKFTVTASIEDVDRLKLYCLVEKKDGSSEKAEFIWDATNKEPINVSENIRVFNYGYLYNYYAFISTGFAPEGWHIPTKAEWGTLKDYVGFSVAGKVLKEAGTDHWNANNGTDNYNMSLVGNGARTSYGDFINLKSIGYYWAYKSNVSIATAYLNYATDYLTIACPTNVLTGRAVRLIKDDSINEGTMTDNDNNVYKTVKIGDQVWTAKNYRCTTLSDGTSIPTVEDDSAWAALTTMGKCLYNNDSKNL